MRDLSASMATESAQRAASVQVVALSQQLQCSREIVWPKKARAINEAEPPRQIQSEISVNPQKRKKGPDRHRLLRPGPTLWLGFAGAMAPSRGDLKQTSATPPWRFIAFFAK
jgi:hypothetical protein